MSSAAYLRACGLYRVLDKFRGWNFETKEHDKFLVLEVLNASGKVPERKNQAGGLRKPSQKKSRKRA